MEKEKITKDKLTKENKKETTALQAISADERKDWISLAFVQAGICVCVPAFLLGAMLAEAMPIWPAIISGSLGYLVVVIGMVITGMMGCDLGVPSCTACEAGFGKKGARFIVSIIFAVNLIGWFGIQNGVCGEAFTNGLQAMTGIYVPVVVSNTVWGLIMLLTAVFGMTALEKLDKISIPLLMIIMLFGLYLAFKIYGRQGLETETVQTMSFMGGVALSFNFTAVGTINAADYTRFQKSRKDTVKSVFYGVFPMGVITLIMGILLTKISGEYDISMVLIDVGLPLFGIAAMIISTWTTNSTNAYSGGLNIVMAFNLKDNKRREATLIAGILGIVLCNIGVLSHIEGVLSLLSYVVCPIGGVIIADYWIVGKGKKQNFRPVDGVNWCGVISWFIGALCAYFLVKVEFSGIIIGGIVYLILEKFMPSTSRDGICEQ
ncbi:purine-cytosine permease family protein [Anaerotignum sp.]|uniref:purine-cytosine permease family protein n=2 Tax=Anaerotignum sp. TaxID=2039241 RepID=UPI003A8A15E3